MTSTRSFAVQIFTRALRVLRTEGPAKLYGKISRRLKTTPLRVPRPSVQLVGPPYPPLRMRACEAPRASVIIPAFNQYQFTYRCLASIQRAASTTGAEWIVVDDCSTDDTRDALLAFPNLKLISNAANLGFVGSCNKGAAEAQAEYLVFLNNDTQVQDGWLDALVAPLDAHAEIGIIGSRLLYPNGRQQEAGAIVFNDASAWKYGHLDAPGRPQYGYLRDVDYVSGAALAVRKSLFERLDGFDELFAPGFYEDVDLAFRARAAGYRVCYQPASHVVHFEGVTAGRDEQPDAGMKRFQAVNRGRLLARWRDVLRSHGAPDSDLELEKDRGARRRVLVVDIYMLTPDRESGSLRMLNFITILQGLGCKVTFAASNLECPEPYLSMLQQRGVEVLYRPHVRSVAQHLRQCGHYYDLVILSRLDTASRFLGTARRFCPSARLVYDTVDLHYLREQRLAALTGDDAMQKWSQLREREELALISQADITLVVSPIERELLRGRLPDADVRVVSNIHEIPGSRGGFGQRRDILFIGSFSHPPNTDGVLWFCREIFPLVMAMESQATFLVVGSDPPAEILAYASERIRVLGYVPDVEAMLATCRLTVAPLRYGAGVKGKVNQSLAHGVPVVATSQGAEGMFLVDEESILIADKPQDFAAAVLRLYREPALWQRLSNAGLEVMERHFSFAAAREKILAIPGLAE
jgi:O-antigen biosynthesis protein